MKKLLLILGLCFLVVTARALSGPGRIPTDTNAAMPMLLDSGTNDQYQPDFTPLTQTSSAFAEVITPDIQALAGNLGNDPARIFNYVHDEIRYLFYFGSKKGAEMTLLERSGNDFDQCALLSALLQAAGYSPGYQFSLVKIPYDSPNQQDLHHWLGLSFYNTNWGKTVNFFTYKTGSQGYSVWGTINGDTNDIVLQHIWVTLSVGGTNYYLDPSFKVSEPIAGINLGSAMGLNTNTLKTDTGGTDLGYYVSGLNEGALRTDLKTYNSNLLSYLSNNMPNATIAQVIGGQQIVSSIGLPLQTSLEFPLYSSNGYPLLNWTNQPTNFMGTLSVSLGGTSQTWYTPELGGKRVSLTFSNNGVAQLWLDDSQIFITTNTSPSNLVNVVLAATLPYGGWNTNLNIPVDTGGGDQSSTNTYQTTNASYALLYAFEASPQLLQSRQAILNSYLRQGLPSNSRDVITETLNVMGLSYMVQTELILELTANEWQQSPQNHYRFGRMSQESGNGYYVDIFLQKDATFPTTGFNLPDFYNYIQNFQVSFYFWSAVEHGIIEQLQSTNLVGASTVKMLELASTNSQGIYLATSTNWSTVESALTSYGTTTKSTLTGLINSGFNLLLPQNGSNAVDGPGSWAGTGYVELIPNGFMGFVIGKGYNGGQDSDPLATPNAEFITAQGNSTSTTYNPQSATQQIATPTGADPVNLVDGSFQIESTDLSLGQTEPRGLNLTRYYSSARRNSNPAGMGPGWLHSYYCNIVPLSDPEAGLGTATVQQMAPMIVATYAALNLYSTNLDAGNWTTTALIAKWGIDQLINNAVSINLGKDTIEFSKNPNGSYAPQANCTMSLIQTNGGYWLQERHGRTFQFGSDNLLDDITDPYGADMSFSYYSNNLVDSVEDCWGRSLTFNYTGSPAQLTSVGDSTGRTVSYVYTGGNLTSYTDPDQKTYSYAYDTNNDITATYDALTRLIVTNAYDGYGHITTQFTLGATNQAWQVNASGYQTIETDPVGDQRIFTYDNKARLISYRDGMGNVTQTFYDGQDHVVETITPKNETNLFIYDGNNNLVETIDPLGFSNVFSFDANNNLITSMDRRHNLSHFGYNAQFRLTGSTNGAGDWLVYTYNVAGNLSSRQDLDGTTTYGYGSFGQLDSITYPGSLGSESFVNSALGDLTSHTDGNGFTTTFAYNNRRQLTNTTAPTNLVTKATFDANGNLSTTTDRRGFVTSNTWSVTRHLLSTTLPTTAQGIPLITNAYDSRDWLLNTRNPLGKLASYTNDAAHRLIASTDPLQRTIQMAYDVDSNETNTIDGALQRTAALWDAAGNLSASVDSATNNIARGYDAVGNLISLTNRNTNVWHFQYDGANRLTNVSSPLSHNSSRTFYSSGLLESTADSMSQPTDFTYDDRGRLSTEVDYFGINDYTFDDNNNLLSIFEFEDTGFIRQVYWTYDAYNRAASFTDAATNIIQYRYDQNGNLTNLIYPGPRTVKYFYDSNNRLTNVTDWANRQTILTYDLAGHMTNVARPNSTVRAMTYDDDGELTNIVEHTTDQFPICFYFLHYNTAGRVDREFKGPLPHPFTPPTRTMTYDADNRLASFNSTSVTLDADGNLTYGPGTNSTFGTFSYNARNELTNAGGISYRYDGTGNRLSMANGTNTTTFVTDPQGNRLLMRINGGTTNYYIYGPGLLYEIDETTTTVSAAFYHFDCRGSTVAISDTNGNPTDLIEYSPYGMITYRTNASGMTPSDTPFLYNGQFGVQTDPSGLLYMRARYYNPYICRFLNADPSGLKGGLNLYVFCNDNPVSLTDPFGLWAGADDLAFTIGGGILGAGGSIISGLISGNLSASKIGYAALAGAAGGEATLYGGPVVGGIVSAAANNVLNQSATMANTGGNFNPYEFGISTAVGGATGAIGDIIPMPSISGLNAGQGSYQAVSSAILTKLENGTIQNISWSTAGTIFMSETYKDIPATALDTSIDILKEALHGEGGGTESSDGGDTYNGGQWKNITPSSPSGK